MLLGQPHNPAQLRRVLDIEDRIVTALGTLAERSDLAERAEALAAQRPAGHAAALPFLLWQAELVAFALEQLAAQQSTPAAALSGRRR